MRSDFSNLCKDARERICVPAVPLTAIRHGAGKQPVPRFGKRRKGLIAAFVAGVSIVAVAAGAEVWGGTHISFNRSGAMEIAFNRGGSPPIQNPTREDVRLATRRADFPVVLPAGLPEGTLGPVTLMSGPGVLLLQYNLPGAWRRSNHILPIILTNRQALESKFESARARYKLLIPRARIGGVHWAIGQEEVFVLPSSLTPIELAHIKSAMIAQSAGASH